MVNQYSIFIDWVKLVQNVFMNVLMNMQIHIIKRIKNLQLMFAIIHVDIISHIRITKIILCVQKIIIHVQNNNHIKV